MVRSPKRGELITCKYLYFNYRERDGTIRTIQLPLLHISIVSALEEEFRTIGLVDTGATSTLMPKEIADVLMLEREERNVEVTGAGGIFYSKPVTLRKLILFKDGSSFATWWNIKVLVPEDENVLPYMILGRDHLFKRFNVTFYEKRRKMAFEKIKS